MDNISINDFNTPGVAVAVIFLAIWLYDRVASVKWPKGSLAESKARFEEKDAELKKIYASMAKFDRLIAERDAALNAGDKELYYAKVKEAGICYNETNELFKD